MYLQFRAITPHSFERKIHLSNGYFSKQIKHLGSVGSDILVKIHDSYPELNMLWVLTGEGQMILEDIESQQVSKVNDFSSRCLAVICICHLDYVKLIFLDFKNDFSLNI